VTATRRLAGRVLVGVLAVLDAAVSAAAGRPVTLPAADGVTLAGQFYEAAARPAPGVVLVHMQSRTRADWDEVAQQLEAAGITVLAIDLRGHGASGGSAAPLAAMVPDVRAAVSWLSTRPTVRPDAIGVAGASLGANLALLAAADQPLARAVAAISPSLDYRGLRVGPETMKKLAGRPVWLAASSEDPYSLRTLKELTADESVRRDQQLSSVAAHGTNLLSTD
jgi:dienelactone hydrolase